MTPSTPSTPRISNPAAVEAVKKKLSDFCQGELPFTLTSNSSNSQYYQIQMDAAAYDMLELIDKVCHAVCINGKSYEEALNFYVDQLVSVRGAITGSSRASSNASEPLILGHLLKALVDIWNSIQKSMDADKRMPEVLQLQQAIECEAAKLASSAFLKIIDSPEWQSNPGSLSFEQSILNAGAVDSRMMREITKKILQPGAFPAEFRRLFLRYDAEGKPVLDKKSGKPVQTDLWRACAAKPELFHASLYYPLLQRRFIQPLMDHSVPKEEKQRLIRTIDFTRLPVDLQHELATHPELRKILEEEVKSRSYLSAHYSQLLQQTRGTKPDIEGVAVLTLKDNREGAMMYLASLFGKNATSMPTRSSSLFGKRTDKPEIELLLTNPVLWEKLNDRLRDPLSPSEEVDHRAFMLFLQILRIHVYLAQDPNRTEKTRDFLRTLNQMRFAESVYDIHPDLAHGNSFLSDFNSSYEGMRKKLVEELFNPLMYGICFLRADYESQKLRLPRFTLPRDLHSGQKEINSYRTHTVERAMFFYTELLRVLEQDKARLPSLMEAKIIDGLRADFALSTMPQRISTISTSYPYLRPQPSAPFAEPGVVLGVAVAVAEEIPSEYVVQGLPAPSAPPHDKMPPPGASPPGVLYHLDVPGPSRKSGGSRDPSPKSITFSCSPPGVSYSDPTPREKTSKQHVGNPGDSGGLFTHSKQPADELSSPSRSGKARDRALKPESSSDFACATPQGRTNFT